MKYIFTTNEQNNKLGLMEITRNDHNFKFEKWLDKNVFLGYSRFNSYEMKTLIEKTPLFFIRHIFKVDGVCAKDDYLQKILNKATQLLDKVNPFSIQLRSTNIKESSEIMKTLSDKLVEQNYILNVKFPKTVISIFVTEENIYYGIDNVECNLSTFNGGEPHFSTKMQFISRAEYKLLEVLNLLNIDWSEIKTAADFGAAPGGWSKVLADKGMYVYAIDPAKLDPKIDGIENVTHYEMTIQEFYRKYPNIKFDLIVNDMKMDIPSSIEILKNFSSRLKDGGYIITTFKLPLNFTYEMIEEDLNSLCKRFKLVLARQLFHNRNEITVVVHK